MTDMSRLRAFVAGAFLGVCVAFPALADLGAMEEWVPRNAVGDLNGDGVADAVVQPTDDKRPGYVIHGAADSARAPKQAQELPANFLNLDWTEQDSTLSLGDFNADGRADFYLQGRYAGGKHAILLTNPQGLIASIAHEFGGRYLGLDWSAANTQAVVGDFQGDGRSDLVLQPVAAGGELAVVLTDETAAFAFGVQTWRNGFLGLNWDAQSVALHAGDFDGDGRADLLVQVLDDSLLVGPQAQRAYTLVTARETGTFDAVSTAWDRDDLDAEWSPETHELIVRDIDRDGIADAWLRARGTRPDYLLLGTPRGFQSVAATWSDKVAAAEALSRAQRGQPLESGPGEQGRGQGSGSPGGEGTEGGEIIALSAATGGGTSSHVRSPVTNYAVGTTPSQFSVDQTGGAHYTIPIQTPPGIAGVQPSLALSYSSRGGNGLAGMGWGISGLSSISRCDKNLAQDGSIAPITYTTADRYCLDGQRLRLESGTYGGHGAAYRTEIDRFARIKSFTSGGSGSVPAGGPQYFTVEMPDGMVYRYGSRNDSRIEAQGTNVARVWALSTIADRFGNSVEYYYTEDNTNGDYRPSQVAWTVRSGQSPFYTADFVYQARPAADVVIGYEAGSVVRSLQRLTRIDIKHSGNLIRDYRLTYDTSGTGITSRSRLQAVQECAGGSCLPPHTFIWQNGKKGWATPSLSSAQTSGNAYSHLNAITLDLNGDGRDDLVYPQAGTWWRAYAGTDGKLGAATSTNRTYYSTYYQYALAMDYDGDGRQDLLVPGQTYWQVLRSNGTGLDVAINTTIPSNNQTRGNGVAADVNGDGLDDFIWSGALGYFVKVALRNTSGTFDTGVDWFYDTLFRFQSSPFGTIESRARSEIRIVNLNGDARADILVKVQANICGGEPGCTNPPADWMGFVSTGSAFTFFDLANEPSMEPLLADLNGDGLTDVLYARGGYWYVRHTKGNAFGSEVNTGQAVQSLTTVLAMDWDGDGKTDLLTAKSGSSNWWVMRSTGTTLQAIVDTGVPTLAAARRVADTDGDGLADILQVANINQYWAHAFHYGPRPDLAVGFKDSVENHWQPTYAPITDASVYTKGTTAGYPLVRDYQGALEVVGSASMPNGIGGAYTLTYFYTGAQVHTQGRGFLGFKTQKVTDSRNAIYRTTTFNQGFPLGGTPSRMDVQQSTGTLIQRTDNTVSFLSSGSGYNIRYTPVVTASISTQYEVGGTYNGQAVKTASSTYTYDAYGNIDLADTWIGAGTTANQFRVLADYTRANYTGTTWCLGRPTTTAVTQTVAGYSTATRTTTATYDSSKCRALTETLPSDTSYPSPNLQLTRTYGYDSYGNASSVAVSGPGVTTRTTIISHAGASGYFPTSVTNPLGHITTTAWNTTHAAPSIVTDPNALVTIYTYDAFGRLATVTEPTQTGLQNTWSWYSSDCQAAVNCQYIHTTRIHWPTNTVNGRSLTFLDLLGRVTTTKKTTLGGWAVNARTYDALGRVNLEYVPYIEGRPPYFRISRTFDLANRVLTETRPASESSPAGSVTNFAYEKLLTRITDPLSKVTERTLNARGEVVQMKDAANGVTSYLYDAFGNLKRTTDPLGNQVNMAYDLRGNKRSMSDPDMGSWIYAYNAFGELTSQTDAKSQTTTFVYDLLGRMTGRTEAEGTTTWAYDTASGKGIGRLYQATNHGYSSSVGYRDTWAYDSLGRPSQRTTRIDGTDHLTNWTYDSFSRVGTMTYPTSTAGYRFAVAHDYDSSGVLWKVKDANAPSTVYWTNDEVNALGQVTQETLGNGLVTDFTIDQATGRTTKIQTGTGSAVQNLEYAWDAVGNLTQRKDNNHSLTESFTYDNLYRLTTGGATYNAIGNLLTLNGTTYSYPASGASSVRPHAVTSTSGSVVGSYAYDANGNMTTKAGETLTWTSYNYLERVERGSGYAEFDYGPDRMRYKQVAGLYASHPETTLYVGGILEQMTRNGVTEWRHLIRAGGRVVAQYNRQSDGSNYLRYLHRDHLGSVAAITNSAGTVNATLSFDAWGRRRNATNWSVYAWNSGSIQALRDDTPRGYTGHEQLDSTGLIHMNGRVYDPYLGKMLSADPTVPGAFNSQAFNRYSYVFNNPMALVDPSGFGPFGFGGIRVTHADGGGGFDNGRMMPNEGCTGSSATACAGGGSPRTVPIPGTQGFSGTGILSNSIPLRFTALGAYVTSVTHSDSGEGDGRSQFNFSAFFGTQMLSGTPMTPSMGPVWPTRHRRIESGYSLARTDPVSGNVKKPHTAIDIANPHGDPVYATDDGIVVDVGTDSAAGNYIKIDHEGALQTSYSHTDAIAQEGDRVTAGQQIGTSDSSGRITGPHLHFVARHNGVRINPCSYLSCPN